MTPVKPTEAAAQMRLQSRTVYETIAAEGETELARPASSILWSGFAAGLAISFSLIAEASLRAHLPDAPWRHIVENFGYVAGFMIVILSRLQLFTENTITPVLPALQQRTGTVIMSMLAIWGTSLFANLVGAVVASGLIVHGGIVPADMVSAALDISHHVASLAPLETFARALPAGFIIAALVWMMPSAEGSEFWVIFLSIYLIALGDFTHVIVGSVELFALVWAGELSSFVALYNDSLPALLGNVLGGTGLFAVLVWAQVREEIDGP